MPYFPQPNPRLEHGDFVELAFSTSQGTIHSMAELLAARRESTSGCLQPFRFVALTDEDHTRLRMALESLSGQSTVRVPSGRASFAGSAGSHQRVIRGQTVRRVEGARILTRCPSEA
jgi:hypothetical protein